MDMKSYLQTLYDYNYWANGRYLDAAAGLTDEQFTRKQGHSWDSVQAVLVHMMSSERMWPMRWKGEGPSTFLKAADFPTLASVRGYWAGVEQTMHSFLAAQTGESLLRDVTYTNPQGQTYTLPLWQMAAHVPNHNTHHRGELAAMFALMNAPHPEEELVQYFLFSSGQKKG
ncbi:MAG TPA: DinB family protein [Anaerolineales bacterium]